MSLQGLEGNGDREPGACGGMWGRRWEGSLEVGDEEGRDGKLLVLPGEPQLVAAIPSQGVQVGEEGGLLHVLPQERVQVGESQFVPRVDVTS